jgi:2-polyprenyl-6-methoxyphenol hydroxylase-like FAD-dependent oxidoreductase
MAAAPPQQQPISDTNPILIIGAGIVGLTLAHALTQSHIPYRIYDRDTALASRGPGWAISIHWARPALTYCLLPTLLAKVEESQVCPGTNDMGRFLFLDLKTAEPRYEIPSAPLLRLNRGRFREVLSGGVEVRWGKRMVGWGETGGEGGGGVEVEFADGERVRGAMLVGADGANSRVRQVLCGDAWQLERLPIRMLGTTVRLSEEEFAPLRAIHPMLFQGCHSETETYMWFSIISVPETNGSVRTDKSVYEGQVNLSWRFGVGAEEPPAENEERLKLMKKLARPFEERLRTLVENLSEDNIVAEIRLQDWPSVEWPNHGRATLIGDAAHAMTMCKFTSS